MGGVTSGLVVLGSIRKQAEQAMERKPVGSTHPWPLHWLLPPGSCPVSVPALNSCNDRLGSSLQPLVCDLICQLTNIFHSFLQSIWLVHPITQLFCLSSAPCWSMWQCQVADESFLQPDPHLTDRKKMPSINNKDGTVLVSSSLCLI